ncbi:MAG: hypothetical protein Q9195_008014 [Heterodermia aff. obscurata]
MGSLNTSSGMASLTDEEIIAQLQERRPITESEKNVWAFWDSGLGNCPAWCQRNVVSWIRRLSPSWTVRFLDNVPGSPNNLSNFIPAEYLPELFTANNQTLRNDPQSGTHLSDIVRLPLVYLYGGIWMDVSFILFRNLDSLCWDVLADPARKEEMCGFRVSFGPPSPDTLTAFFNGFIAARRHNLCIKLWNETCLAVWKGTENTLGMHKHELLRHLPRYESPGQQSPFKYEDYVDYIYQMVCLERLRHVKDEKAGWDGPSYFGKGGKVLLFDCVSEVYWAQRLTMWNGRKQFELLATSTDPDVAGKENYEEAKAFVDGILAMSSTMKFSGGLKVPGVEYIATLWNESENKGKDNAEGTFSAELRRASVGFEQKKELISVEMVVSESVVLVGNVLEVVGEPRAL